MQRKMKNFKSKCLILLAIVLALLFLLAASCENKNSNDHKDNNSGNKGSHSGQVADNSASPVQNQYKVTLYFADDQAMYLLSEERTISLSDNSLETVVIEALISGPQKDGLVRTIPEGTKLLSAVTVSDGVAEVNFSKEFRDKHWGGSAGEMMTLYSVVNSLCEIPGIEKVQFLLENEKQESILNGNMETRVPIEPDYDLVNQ